MGYYTHYNLDMDDGERSAEIIEKLRSTNDDAHWAFTSDGSCETEVTWYEHEADMREFSKQYADVVFTLDGDGDGSDDMWTKYFKNGKMQACYGEVVYPPYDAAKLE